MVKNFSFTSTGDRQNWSFSTGGGAALVQTYENVADSPNDTDASNYLVRVARTGRNKSDGTPEFIYAGSWESLGVPAGATVTAVNLSFDWQCSNYITGATSDVGPAILTSSSDVTLGTFSSSSSFSSTTSWATKTGTQITGLSQASSTSIKLKIGTNPKTGNASNAAVYLDIDWVVVTITYGVNGTAACNTITVRVAPQAVTPSASGTFAVATASVAVVPAVDGGEYTKSFSFYPDFGGWVFVPNGMTGYSSGLNSGESPNDPEANVSCLSVNRNVAGKTDGDGYWEYSGSWESLGVPSGTTVSQANLRYDWQCASATGVESTSSTGPARLCDAAGSEIGVFSSSQGFTGTTSWAIKNGTAITGLSSPSSATVKFRVHANPRSTAAPDPWVILFQDYIVITVVAAASRATGTATAVAATVSVNVTPQTATAQGGSGSPDGNAACSTVSVNVSAVVATGSGGAVAVVAEQSVTVAPQAATATGEANAVAAEALVSVLAQAATVDGAANVAVATASVLVTPQAATGAVSGDGTAVCATASVTVTVVVATASGDAAAASATGQVNVSPQASIASGDASFAAATASVLVNPQAATGVGDSNATAICSTVSVSVAPQNALALIKTYKYVSFSALDIFQWPYSANGASNTQSFSVAENSPNDTIGDSSLFVRRSTANQSDGDPYYERSCTWQDLGVPSSDTVIAVNLSYDWRCRTYSGGSASSSIGPATLRDSSGNLTGTFSSSSTFGATTSWATKSGAEITGLSQPSSTSIKLRVNLNPKTATGGTTTVEAQIDWIVIEITHTPSANGYAAVATASVNVATVQSTPQASSVISIATAAVNVSPQAAVGSVSVAGVVATQSVLVTPQPAQYLISSAAAVATAQALVTPQGAVVSASGVHLVSTALARVTPQAVQYAAAGVALPATALVLVSPQIANAFGDGNAFVQVVTVPVAVSIVPYLPVATSNIPVATIQANVSPVPATAMVIGLAIVNTVTGHVSVIPVTAYGDALISAVTQAVRVSPQAALASAEAIFPVATAPVAVTPIQAAGSGAALIVAPTASVLVLPVTAEAFGFGGFITPTPGHIYLIVFDGRVLVVDARDRRELIVGPDQRVIVAESRNERRYIVEPESRVDYLGGEYMTRIKDPNEKLDYTVDVTNWLNQGDAIATATWAVPSPLVKVNEANTTTTSTVVVSGGTLGQTYELVCTIDTAAGLKLVRRINLSIAQR